MGFLSFYPFATGVFGTEGQEFTELLGLNPRQNSERILERIRELEIEKARLKKLQKMKQTQGYSTESGIMSPFKSMLKRLSLFFSRNKKEKSIEKE